MKQESYITEFKGNHNKQSETTICICGPSGAGKGTLGQFIADHLNINYYSAGDFFRQIAKDKGMTVEELSEQADKETDLEVDRRTLEKGLNEDCVIESRIAAWVLGDYADLKIYITADLEERAQRIKEDLVNRENEEAHSNLQKAKEIIKKRDMDNAKRYKDYYGINMNDSSIFDVVMDNTEMSVEEQNQLIEKALDRKPDL